MWATLSGFGVSRIDICCVAVPVRLMKPGNWHANNAADIIFLASR